MTRRSPTTTSNFGVGKRESHDASAFYERFERPEVSDDDRVVPPYRIDDPFVNGDARDMRSVADGSVALVVTSPPYFAGKQYEEELARDGIPSSYTEYLQLLRDVFAECKRKLEPGGRIAVNVANLGRRPYRSLSADVIRILQDDLHLLLRGEVIWRKGEGAAGNCAWGSFRNPTNPVLRDLTERVVIASKGRFDRARTPARRAAEGLPHEFGIDADEFMAATLDVWDLPTESARRVQHPAPFPVALPKRLIRLYTFRDDLVLDPFMGSGSTLVAAAQLGRRYVGYDLDAGYCAIARRRVEAEGAPDPDVVHASGDRGEAFEVHAAASGASASALARELLEHAGFEIVAKDAKVGGTGARVSLVGRDADGEPWYFDLSGAFTTTRSGLARPDAAWRAVGRAHVLARHGHAPFVLLTSHLPDRRSEADAALRAAGRDVVFDVIELRSADGVERLSKYARGGHRGAALPGFWSDSELG